MQEMNSPGTKQTTLDWVVNYLDFRVITMKVLDAVGEKLKLFNKYPSAAFFPAHYF